MEWAKQEELSINNMSRTTDALINKRIRIQELLEALQEAPEEDAVWIINQLQEIHAENYRGTDDDMLDNFEYWLERQINL